MKTWFLPLFLLVAVAATESTAAENRFKFKQLEEGQMRLEEHGQGFYHFQLETKSLAGKYPRANYLHPVYDPDGVTVTEDFPTDHLHHRGIFWTWHQVRLRGEPVSDPWVCENIEWGRPTSIMAFPRRPQPPRSAHLTVSRDWLIPDPAQPGHTNSIMRETVKVVAPPTVKGIRRLDFTLRFRAQSEGVTLGGSDDVKGYGGFSPRIRLSEDVRFIGQTGPVKPQKTAVESGAWMNVTRTLDGKKRSVTILVHPSHPDFPLKWILRKKNSMQNPQWPGRQPVPISTQEDTILRYRLLLHNNLLKPKQIEQEWQTYSGD